MPDTDTKLSERLRQEVEYDDDGDGFGSGKVTFGHVFAEAAAALDAKDARIAELTEEVARVRNGYEMAKLETAEVHAEVIASRDKLLAEAREVLKPFAAADGAIGDEPGPFRFETGPGYRTIEREDLRRARSLLLKLESPDARK